MFSGFNEKYQGNYIYDMQCIKVIHKNKNEIYKNESEITKIGPQAKNLGRLLIITAVHYSGSSGKMM